MLAFMLCCLNTYGSTNLPVPGVGGGAVLRSDDRDRNFGFKGDMGACGACSEENPYVDCARMRRSAFGGDAGAELEVPSILEALDLPIVSSWNSSSSLTALGELEK